MNTPWMAAWAWLLMAPAPIETRFEQLAPGAMPVGEAQDAIPRRRPAVQRAVVLLHGLRVQPISEEAARRAEPSYWEKPQAPVVKALASDTDVYAFHFGQTASLDEIARLPALARAIRSLRATGYTEIVLVGYSAGGVIARLFVEDHPDAGVTKVVQVASPNGGSDWTVLGPGVRAAQEPFIRSLTKDERLAVTRARADRRIPAHIDIVCVVSVASWISDGVVRRDAQWTPDLQAQGVPAETIHIPHFYAMYSSRLASRVAELVRTPQPRWSPEQVAAARGKVLGVLSVLNRPTPNEPTPNIIRVEARDKPH